MYILGSTYVEENPIVYTNHHCVSVSPIVCNMYCTVVLYLLYI